MGLQLYNQKRDFAKTPEPAGKASKAKGHSFVIQKHDATRLHYDFRLELDGVLLSWAVTKGPSLNPSDKRLAVRTEDHPLSYGGFEGTIPAGQYGGGTVMLWDSGTWEPLEDPRKGLKEGSLKFKLHGERLNGSWALVLMKGKASEKRENWLLIKHDDEDAVHDEKAALKFLDDTAFSIRSGRSMDAIGAGTPAKAQKTAAKPKAAPKVKAAKSKTPSLAALQKTYKTV